MKSKTIKKVLKIKINDWLKSITDESVRNLAGKNTIVTGGAIASMLLKEKVNDFDVYFSNKETALAVARYYVRIFNEKHGESAEVLDGAVYSKDQYINSGFAGAANLTPDRIKIGIKSKGVSGEQQDEPHEGIIEHLDDIDPKALDVETEKEKYQPVYLSSNAITLTNRIQIIIRFYGNADELHENYDFVHCTNYYEHSNSNLVLRPQALEAILAKELKYVGSKYPLCSIIRTRKFIARGFSINAGQYLKMCFQLSNLDLSDINILEDQLIGVDSAYFGMLIEGLKTKLKDEPEYKIEQDYITTIIDRIF